MHCRVYNMYKGNRFDNNTKRKRKENYMGMMLLAFHLNCQCNFEAIFGKMYMANAKATTKEITKNIL